MIELHMDLLRRTLSKTAQIPGRKSEVYEEHLLILQAIKERDPVKAKLALLNHLRRVKETYRKTTFMFKREKRPLLAQIG